MDTSLLKKIAKRGAVYLLSLAVTLAPFSVPLGSARAESAPAAQNSLELTTGKGTLVNLPAAADAVFISNPEIADVEIKFPELLYVYGIKPGETSIHVMDKNQKVIFSQNIVVTRNVEGLRVALEKLLPEANIEVFSSNLSIVLRGTVKSAAEADMALKIANGFVSTDGSGDDDGSGATAGNNSDKIINMLTIGGASQITLKVKIAEVRREVSQLFGIDWQTGENKGNWRGAVLSRAAPLGQAAGTAGTTGATSTFVPGALGNVNVTQQAFKAVLGYAEGTFSIDALITALETEGYVTILAEPNLTAISGETASFLAGGEFPIAVPDGQGGSTVQFKEYGIALNFAPILMSPDRIRLKVNPVVSELTNEGSIRLPGQAATENAIPGLLSRKADTTVELGNGQSFTIAGLFNQSFRDSINKHPWLADVPVLGALFRSQNFARKDSELVIIVTPYIVEPTSETNLATPLDNMKAPSDKDRILYGQTPFTSIRPTNFFGTAGARLSGPVGFIVE